MVLVVGVDGCRGGWVAAHAETDGPRARVVRITKAPRLCDALGDVAVAAVDIPIGLPSASPATRACDAEARRILRPHGARVFPAPVRAALDFADDYPEACEASRRASGRALSRQAWNLIAKIREADELAGVRPLVECHPEVAFALMSGHPVAASKKTPAGRSARIALLESHLDGLSALAIPRGDDAIDALACAWSAARLHAGAATVLGDGSVDARGRPMRIVA